MYYPAVFMKKSWFLLRVATKESDSGGPR